MIASILQCEYIKHGMTCQLGNEGNLDVILLVALIAFCSCVVMWANSAGRR